MEDRHLPGAERKVTLGDWVMDFATLIQAAWGLSALETISLSDSLLEALAESDLVLHLRSDALPLPSRLRRNILRGAVLEKLTSSEALTEAVYQIGANAGGPRVSSNALARLFLDQIRVTYEIPPVAAIQVHQAVAQVLSANGMDLRPMISIPRLFERELVIGGTSSADR